MNFSVEKTEDPFKKIIDRNGDEIATVWSAYCDDVEATARMFAAAPELLNACLMMASDSFSFPEAMEAIHSAIAKAKGE